MGVSDRFAQQFKTTNTVYFTGNATPDGYLNIGLFDTDPRNEYKRASPLTLTGNSKLYIMCQPDVNITANTQSFVTLNNNGKEEITKLVPKENMSGFWAETEKEVLEKLEEYDPSRKFLQILPIENASDKCFTELLRKHTLNKNIIIAEDMATRINTGRNFGTVQIPFYSKESNVLFRHEYGRKFRIQLNAPSARTPIRILYHLEIEYREGENHATGILEAFTEEFSAFTKYNKQPNTQPTLQPQQWINGIWMHSSKCAREDAQRDGPEKTRNKSKTQNELESAKLRNPGMLINNDKILQLWTHEEFAAHIQLTPDGNAKIYYTKNGKHIENSLLQTLKRIDDKTAEVIVEDTETGETTRHTFEREN